MAFGDLPQSQHQILVMRELEGLSYDRIGSRLGLTRGAVESQLFRARRTLRDGFDDIDTGERCVRMRVTMEATADGLRTGMRERRRLTMHLRDCADCRRTAVTIGLDDLALAAARDRGRALRRIAGLLPLPGFLRRRMEDGVAAFQLGGPGGRGAGRLAGRQRRQRWWSPRRSPPAEPAWRQRRLEAGFPSRAAPDNGSGGAPNGSGDGDGAGGAGSGSGECGRLERRWPAPGAAGTRDAAHARGARPRRAGRHGKP